MDYARASQINTGVGTPLSSPDQAESASRIRDAVCRTEELLSTVHDAIARLEKRLTTVLKPEPPATVSQSTPKNQLVGSHLLGRVEILNEGFDAAVGRLINLAERVEV